MANRNKKKVTVWYEGLKWFVHKNKKVEPTNWKTQALLAEVRSKSV